MLPFGAAISTAPDHAQALDEVIPAALGQLGGWPDLPDGDQASVLLLADPFTFPADSFLERLNEEQPGLPVIGGMVSGAAEPGQHRLLCSTDVLEAGAV